MADWTIAPHVWVPDEAIEIKAVRSGGPGGQHVNKVASKVELRVPLEAIQGLNPAAHARLVLLCGHRVTNEGVLVLTSTESRHQFQNRQEVERKLVELVKQALVVPKMRLPTRATRGSKERRLDSKKAHAQKKQGRGRIQSD